MIYFKHYTDSNRGASIQALLNEFGHMGYCYWPLVEMCAEKLDFDKEVGATESDCLFRFSERIVRQNLRISRTNVRKFLDKCAEFSLLKWKLVGNELEIEMPKLLEYLDYDQKRARTKSGRRADADRLDKDIDINTDKTTIVPLVGDGLVAGIEINKPVKAEYERLVQIWNETVKNLPKVKNISKARIKKISARWSECQDVELWKAAIKMLDRSDWSNGKSERGWVADFDYLIRPEKFIGLIEKAQQAKQTKPKEKPVYEIPEGFLKS